MHKSKAVVRNVPVAHGRRSQACTKQWHCPPTWRRDDAYAEGLYSIVTDKETKEMLINVFSTHPFVLKRGRPRLNSYSAQINFDITI